MPDVGVLNLQIHENSSQAETGLNKVAGALNRIKTAINGSGLKTVVSGLKGINEALTSMSSNDAENKLNRIAAALNRVKEASNFTVPNLNGINKALGGLGKSGSGVAGMEKAAESAENAGKVIEGAFETVNEKISTNPDSMQGVNDGMETVGETAEKVAESVGQSMDQIERKTESVKEQLAKFQGLRDEMHEKYAAPTPEEKHEQNLQSAWSYVQRAKSDAEREAYAKIYKVSMEELKARFATPAQENIRETVQAVTQNAPEAPTPQSTGMEQVAPAVKEASAAMDEAKQKSSVLASAMEKLKGAAKTAMDGFHSLGKAMSKLPLVHLGKQFLNIAKRMAIRGAVKMLTSAFQEGYANIYEYSNAIGGSFAQSLDNARASLMTMKNSIGAAVAPAIQALIPVLQTVVSWVITAANAINQLLSLLSGKTSWTKAVDQGTAALDKQKKAAKGAGGAVKDMLAAWDELNVISNDGGGGGGGGAAAIATDYASMFEEVTQFDQRIEDLANKIKDVVGWIKDNMDVVLTTVGLIGAAILLWKVSKAFDGFIGDLAKMLAGGAILTLGVVLSYDFGKKLGSGKKLNGGDIIEGIAGVVAGAIGGYMIGGGIGAAVGVAISLTAMLVGYIQGQRDQLDKVRWGNITMTPEQIKAYVKKRFSFDVEAEINLLNTGIRNAKQAKEDLDKKTVIFSALLTPVRIGVDISEDAINKAFEAYKEVVAGVQTLINENQKLSTITFKVLPYDKGTEEQVTKDVFSADKELNDYFENYGKKIAAVIDKGIANGWKANEREEAIALMEHMDNVLQLAEESKAGNEFVTGTRVLLSDFSRDTAKGILDQEKELIEGFKNSSEEAVKTLSENYLYLANLAEASGLTGTAEKYRNAAKTITSAFNETVRKKMSSDMTAMGKEWMDALSKVYNTGDIEANMLAIMDDKFSVVKSIKKLTESGQKEEAAKALNSFMEEVLKKVDPEGITLEASQLFGFTGWDFMGDMAKKMFFETLYQEIGDEAVPLLARSLKIPVKDIMSVVDWNSFTNTQKTSFILSIGEAYGGSAALQAAKNAGVDIGTVIGDGLSSTDEATKGKAQALVQSIRETLAASGVEVPVDASVDVLVNAMVEVEATSTTAKIQNMVSSAQAKVNTITGALSDVVNRVRKIAGHANGAYDIPSGELFMARENGITEYVGSIGGKASVANNDQIEEGISKGVAKANEEQNALLRQQNDLLRRILAKEMKVDLGSKASFGRTVRQSLDAYESMAGV